MRYHLFGLRSRFGSASHQNHLRNGLDLYGTPESIGAYTKLAAEDVTGGASVGIGLVPCPKQS